MGAIPYIEDFEEWKSEFSFYIPIKVRFSETDMFGHVNNVSAFIYFEEARIEFLKSKGLFSDPQTEQAIPVVADLQCNFLKQMYFDMTIRLYVKVARVGTSSFDIHYMALNEEDHICLTGRGRLVSIDKETGKALPLKEKMKQKLIEKD